MSSRGELPRSRRRRRQRVKQSGCRLSLRKSLAVEFRRSQSFGESILETYDHSDDGFVDVTSRTERVDMRRSHAQREAIKLTRR